jgi:hypothetical protein
LAGIEETTILIVALVVVIAVCATVILAMRQRYTKKPQNKKPDKPAADPVDLQYTNMPFRVSKSIQGTMANSAKDELRMLDLEQQILGDALRRLYEAQGEGKITESEREKLAGMYINRMNIIKGSINKDQNIIALHELEGMQEDLMKLFSERFGDLTSKVEELRGKIDVKPIREIPIKMPQQPTQIEEPEEGDVEEPETGGSEASEKKQPAAPKKRKPAEEKPDQKTESERRIDALRGEIEKALDRLGQMEAEA